MQRVPYVASVLLSAVALILLVVNVSLTIANRSKQTELAQRQPQIAQGQTIVQLDQGIARLVADSSIKNNDLQLHSLLTAEGITFQNDANAPAQKPSAK